MVAGQSQAGTVIFVSLFIAGIIVLFMYGSTILAEYDYFAPKTWEKIFKEDAKYNLNGYPLVFVHGLAGNFDHWEKTIKTISGLNHYKIGFLPSGKIYDNYHDKKTNVWVWNTSYYTNDIMEESMHGDLTQYTGRLQVLINTIKEITGKDKVVIVAHSMGGLISRKYMTLNRANWDSVYKILTIGTPSEGVTTSIGVVGQLEDLKQNSNFIKTLDIAWSRMEDKDSKWGVIGAVDDKVLLDRKITADATDSAGPGFVTISSAIPFGEWKEAVKDLGKKAYNTPHFAFRLAVNGRHMELLYHKGTFEGLLWAVTKF